MARNISLTNEEIQELEKKLGEKSVGLPEDEAKFLSFLLGKARAERTTKAEESGPGWLFTWTYRF